MIMSKVSLRRTRGAQGALAKVLLDGSEGDRGHSLIWSLFSSSGAESRSFLYRQIDPGRFITVSRRAPEDSHDLWEVQPKEYAPDLEAGQRLGFVLRANPAMAARTPGAPRGTRVDAIMHAKHKLAPEQRKAFSGVEAAALDWLEARGSAVGAHFDRERCSATGYQQIFVRKAGAHRPIAFSEIDFEGVLTVIDPVSFTAALFNGLGKAKAYGCGLMLVRRA
jgi:CRISPR system Cascade subunit CasE